MKSYPKIGFFAFLLTVFGSTNNRKEQWPLQKKSAIQHRDMIICFPQRETRIKTQPERNPFEHIMRERVFSDDDYETSSDRSFFQNRDDDDDDGTIGPTPSRAIPIPHKNHRLHTATPTSTGRTNDENNPDLRRRYEEATWKMYDLIVSYRQKNPMGQRYNPKDVIVPLRKDLVGSSTQEKQEWSPNKQQKSFIADEEEEDGLIFDMDP